MDSHLRTLLLLYQERRHEGHLQRRVTGAPYPAFSWPRPLH